MKKAIFKKFIIILTLALTLSGSIFGVIIGKIISDQTKDNMFYTLQLVDSKLDYNQDLKTQIDKLKEISANKKKRFTIMDLKGNIYADSDVADITSLENHGMREEVAEALYNGSGDSRRYSKTLNVSMLYVARVSENGNYILRLAVPFSGMKEYVGQLLPAILISIGITLVVSSILARQFSRSMTKPLRKIAEEMRKLNDDNPEFHFDIYRYEEMNVIAETTMQMAQAVKESMKQIEFEKMVRQEFFSNASHELKTPITSIRGYSELLEQGIATDEKTKKDFLSRIKKETENMTNLINDILMISRLETKEAEVVLTEVRLWPLLEEVFASLNPLAAECMVSLEMNCRPLVMWANAEQLRVLFSNLIINAIRYNKAGGKVSVTITSEQGEIIIIVEDTGVGIPEDAKQRVFERFYRVDKGRSKKMGGTGLGLSIVKHIVNYYNGTIELESKLSVGSKFMIRFPKE